MTCAKRLIDANESKRRIIAFATGCHTEVLTVDSIIMILNQSDTVDAAEVVRCKACDWYRKDGSICVNPKCGKSWYGCRVPEQHYCSYGERKDNGC